MNLPSPFDSRKLWGLGLGLAAVTILGMTGHDSGPAVAAITTITAGGVGTQAVLDYRAGGSSPTDKAP